MGLSSGAYLAAQGDRGNRLESLLLLATDYIWLVCQLHLDLSDSYEPCAEIANELDYSQYGNGGPTNPADMSRYVSD